MSGSKNISKDWKECLKTALFIILFLLLTFPLDKYSPDRIFESSIPGKQKEEQKPVEEEKSIEKEKLVSSVPKEKKKKVEDKLSQVKLEPLPVSISQIDLQSVAIPDDSILIGMDQLIASLGTSELRIVKKFYIPPVEYKTDFKKLILPASLITVGALASQTEDYRDIIPIPRPDGKVKQHRYDDYLQYVVPSTLFIYDIFGKEKHHPIDQFFVMGISYGLTALEVRNLKSILKEERPDGGSNSFPSGHTAVAFVGAHMIYKEFKDSNPFIAYSGYAMAGAVGVGRMINNRHWLSDVVAGAGFAILSVELAYMVYFPVRNLITNGANKLLGKYFIVTPVMRPQELGLQMNYTF